MSNVKKTIRYYYWFIVEYVKKHLKLIILSFFLTFFALISFVSLSPYLSGFLTQKQKVIGYVGSFNANSLPEEITAKISNGLVFINEKGDVIPVIAGAWRVSEDQKTYYFHLKDNLFWDDGKEISAFDIKYLFKDVAYKPLDKNTLEFKLTKPLQIFPTFLKIPIIKFPFVGIGGLYKAEQYKTQYGVIKELALSPNRSGLPYLKYKFYDTETHMVSAYKRGEINEFSTTKKSIATLFSNWKNSQVNQTVDYSRLLTLFYNTNNPLLKPKEIRQAINTSFKFKDFEDDGKIAIGPIPPTSWAYNTDLKPPTYEPDSAEKMVKKSLTASQSANIILSTYFDYLEPAEEISEFLRQIGLNPNLTVISSERPSDFDLLLAFLRVPQDPDQYFFWHQTQTDGNIGSYKNVKIDKLLEDGRSTLSPKQRKKIYEEFQKNIIDDPPAAFIYFPYIYTISRK